MPTVIRNKDKTRGGMLPLAVAEILPSGLVTEIEARGGELGSIEEIRLRRERRASLTVSAQNVMLGYTVSAEELEQMLAAVCGNSLYAHSETINSGYITLDGGVRVGIVGRAAVEDGRVIGVYDVSSMCIRLPRKILKVGAPICELLRSAENSEGVLVYAPPGVGKTTLLRGVARAMASGERPLRVALIDTRGELGFSLDGDAVCIDVMTGYPRALGIDIAARCMNAQLMICDEIGDASEAEAIISAQNCGVPFVASAHSDTLEALLCRSAVKRLHKARIFGWYVGIRRARMDDFEYKITSYEEADEYYQYR